MSYADGLLSTGERITYRNKQHPFIFVWGARYAILAIVGALVLLWFQGNFTGVVQQLLGTVGAVLFFGGVAVGIWNALRYLNQEYVLTNRRVIQVEGVLNRSSTDSSLEKINDAVLTQSVFGRMFDFGDLTVLTASESGIDKMRMLRSPIVFKKAMLDAKHEFEVDMERSGWAPGPPIRDGSGAPVVPAGSGGAALGGAAMGGAPTSRNPETSAASGRPPEPDRPAPTADATAAPPPAPTPAPAPRADPDEVTRTLTNLADLRDRGAITAEEYERKKADLLSAQTRACSVLTGGPGGLLSTSCRLPGDAVMPYGPQRLICTLHVHWAGIGLLNGQHADQPIIRRAATTARCTSGVHREPERPRFGREDIGVGWLRAMNSLE